VDWQKAARRGDDRRRGDVNITSIIAIYFLFFAAATFVLLPFGVKTTEEVGGEKIPGQADSAPHRFDLKRHLIKAMVVAAVLFGLYYANWSFGWVTANDFDLYDNPQAQQSNS
jgi:predicted secreted protein